jgi:UDP-3-O-[3-hydroxymyristoyl] N-acetylglucosamine deacetylase
MNKNQTTIKSKVIFKGTGIHSECKVCMTVVPAKANNGIVFFRKDQNNKKVPVSPNNLSEADRATVLKSDNIFIKTPEHFLAACYGLGIDNLDVYIDNEEVPIMDGSAIDFVKKFHDVGLTRLKEEKRTPLIVREDILINNKDQYLIALPNNSLKLTYLLSYPDTFIGCQTFSQKINKTTFVNELAPARTYGFYNEVKILLDKGLAKGGTINNAVIIGEKDYMNKLRFDDELVRHKTLDLIGDLAVLGNPIKGHFIAVKSGHALNKEMVHRLNNL